MKLLSVVFFLICTTLGSAASSSSETPINICVDNNYWGPYTFTFQNRPVGVHVEIVERALQNLQLPYTTVSAVWNRCVEGSKTGYYDAILAASFSEDRAHYFYYPEDAGSEVPSEGRVTQAEYVAVVRAENFRTWNGREETLPQPVGLPLGYAVTSNFTDKNLPVLVSHKYSDLFHMLLMKRVGSLLVLKQTAELYMSETAYFKHLRVMERPYQSRSYFLPFSKGGRVSPETAERVWREIATIRENKPLRQEIEAKIDKLVEACFRDPSICNY